ncbi:hypothetical protein MPSEU_000308700 [Mayamaea pseudoterrestris]|nr:hypothetical protein MPSEU_000308700 [Mayamaea pseudoterrestris]
MSIPYYPVQKSPAKVAAEEQGNDEVSSEMDTVLVSNRSKMQQGPNALEDAKDGVYYAVFGARDYGFFLLQNLNGYANVHKARHRTARDTSHNQLEENFARYSKGVVEVAVVENYVKVLVDAGVWDDSFAELAQLKMNNTSSDGVAAILDAEDGSV